jgi:hypothetical protein
MDIAIYCIIFNILRIIIGLIYSGLHENVQAGVMDGNFLVGFLWGPGRPKRRLF